MKKLLLTVLLVLSLSSYCFAECSGGNCGNPSTPGGGGGPGGGSILINPDQISPSSILYLVIGDVVDAFTGYDLNSVRVTSCYGNSSYTVGGEFEMTLKEWYGSCNFSFYKSGYYTEYRSVYFDGNPTIVNTVYMCPNQKRCVQGTNWGIPCNVHSDCGGCTAHCAYPDC